MEWTKEDFEKLRMQDKKCFERFFYEYKDKVYNFLLIKTNWNKNIAEEIFSETFLSCWQSIAKLQDIKKMGAWIMKIAANRFNDYLRKEYKHKNNVSFIEEENIDNPDINSETERKQEEREKLVIYKMAMENIKPRYSQILRLKYIDEKSEKEISEILKKSITAIEALLFRARNALKKEINNLMKQGKR